MKIEWKAGGAFLMYFVVVFVAAQAYGLVGYPLYLILGLLGALGLTGAGLWVYFTKKKEKEEGGAPADAGGGGGGGDAAIDQLIHEADHRVSQSSATQGAKIANLPLVFVVGDQGATKTSALVYSGIEPELLSGSVFGEGNAVAPTQHVNVWFARGSTFVEAAGKVFADPVKWKALVRRLKPGSWKSLVGKGEQAPRGVLLCYDAENFARPGAAEQIATAARYIQARLTDISDGLGISYPVYILFTRTDRVPFFQEFVRNLSNEEATQVFGATLPLRDVQSGVYAEEETRRLTRSFDDLFYSLADKRCVLLPRDADPLKTPQPYEFPREFRKLRNSLVQFMVDCCRPSQLKASPFLRGFYFSGVRPVTVSSAPVVSGAAKKEDAFKQAGAATQMFSAAMLQQAQQQHAMAGAQQPGRRVPQWLFLGHLFNDILLKDSTAMSASGSSVKTSFLQRLLLGGLAGLLLLYSIGLAVSFFRNKSMEDQAIAAAQGLKDVKTDIKTCEVPTLEQLQKLDTLRQSLVQLTEYETDGAPLMMRLGLYAGSDMYPEVRKTYFDKFKTVLFGGTQTGLVNFMKTVGAKGKPDATDSFDIAYDSVKSYLLTTSEFGRVKSEKDRKYGEFLARTLHARWACKPEEAGAERMELAKKQFEFYANDLVNGNPYSKDRDASVPAAQRYLREFSGEEAAFQGLLAKADREQGPKTFNEFLSGSAVNVIGNVAVRYAYTKKGYEFMSKAIDKADFGSEPWVLGEGGSNIPAEELKKRVRERYAKAYIEIWRKVTKDARFVPYGQLQAAKDRLPAITGSTAPIPGLFWWVSHNTNVDLAGVKAAFAPVHTIQPPAEAQVFNTQNLLPYNNSILGLMAPVDNALVQGADTFTTAQNLKDAASNAERTTLAIAAGLPVDAEASLHTTVKDLMLRPIVSLPVPKGGAEVDAAGGAFCGEFNQLSRKFPFNYEAKPEVSPQELDTIFKPNGQLTKLTQDLQAFVKCSAVGQPNCEKAPTAKANVNPQFLQFLNQSLSLQRALYPDGQNLGYKFQIRPSSDFFDRFELNFNNDRSEVRAGATSKQYTFTSSAGYFAPKITQKGNASGQEVQGEPGFWSVFRFFARADQISGQTFTFFLYSNNRRVQFEGKDMRYDFTIQADGPPILSKDYLKSLKCVGKVIQ
jgi:type VI secretion system protein ImpL